MNPICKQKINSAECQQWMSEVFAHCNRLLADKQLEFWDDWWLNDRPMPYYQLPRLMSAFDCQKLKKEIERQAAESSELSQPLLFELDNLNEGWRLVLGVLVVCLSLGVIGFMVWLLNSTLRRIASPRFNDCERQRYRKNQCRSPRSFISFGSPSNPLTPLGPYRTKKVVVPRDVCTPNKR